MSPEQVQQGLDVWFAAFNAMDVERYLAASAADAVMLDPVGSTPLENDDARRAFFTGLTSMFQAVSLKQEHTYIVENYAAVHWSGNCTTTGGKAITFSGIDILTFNEDGKVTRQMSYWEPSKLMAQIEG